MLAREIGGVCLYENSILWEAGEGVGSAEKFPTERLKLNHVSGNAFSQVDISVWYVLVQCTIIH